MTTRRPPNLVFIMADQLAAAVLGCYGGGVASTPGLDALAARGMRFTRAYAASPVCGPNRACILTGRSPAINGVVTNNLEVATDSPTWPEVLAGQGYRVGGFGKFHHTNMQLPEPADMARYGFHESVVTEDPRVGAYLAWIARTAPDWLPTAEALAWPRDYWTPAEAERHAAARRRILDPLRAASPWGAMYPSPLPARLHQTTWITDLGLDFISRHRRSHPRTPFCCHLSYVDPHDPYCPPAPYASLFDPAAMPPATPAAWLAEGNPVHRQSQDFEGFHAIAQDAAAIARLRALYHGSLRFLDDQIARVTALLDAEDLWRDTILVFTTDHGDMLGDQALITKGTKFFDKSIRVPLLVAGRGVVPGTSDVLASSLDLFPTLCDWAGTELPPPLEGRSLAPICRGGRQADPWPAVAIEAPYYMPGVGPGEAAVRGIVSRDGWRLTVFDRDGLGELFDLVNDPDEQRNRYRDPACAGRKAALFELMTRTFMHQTAVQQYRNLTPVDGRRRLVGPGGTLHQEVWRRGAGAV